jgi:hypothetical protein
VSALKGVLLVWAFITMLVLSGLLLLLAGAPLDGDCLMMTKTPVPEGSGIDQVSGGYAEPFRCIATTPQGDTIVMQEGPRRSEYAIAGFTLPIASAIAFRRYRRRQDINRGRL